MYYVVGAIIAVILLLLIGVFYVQLQETKKRVAKQKALMEQTRVIQKEFKQQAQILMDATIINSQQKQKFCYLANNFFVFQSVSDIGVTNLQKMTDYFSSIVTHATSLEVSEMLVDIFSNAASRVPNSARDFTSTFYLSSATQLLSQLKNDINALANGDIENEETTTEESTTAENDNNDEDIENEEESNDPGSDIDSTDSGSPSADSTNELSDKNQQAI